MIEALVLVLKPVLDLAGRVAWGGGVGYMINHHEGVSKRRCIRLLVLPVQSTAAPYPCHFHFFFVLELIKRIKFNVTKK